MLGVRDRVRLRVLQVRVHASIQRVSSPGTIDFLCQVLQVFMNL